MLSIILSTSLICENRLIRILKYMIQLTLIRHYLYIYICSHYKISTGQQLCNNYCKYISQSTGKNNLKKRDRNTFLY